MKRRWIIAGIAATALAGGMLILEIRDDRHVSGIEAELNNREPLHGVFSVDMVDGLPDPAQRYFLHAIQPGTPLANRLRWRYTGEMKPGKNMPWMPIRAEQVLVADRGFVWKVSARWGPVLISGVDYYLDGDSRMKIVLFGVAPIVNASDEQIAKSAMGRLLIEGFAMPSTLLPDENVRIEPVDDATFRAVVSHRGEQTPLTLTVDKDGRLQSISMERWGNVTDDGSYQFIPYGGKTSGEIHANGYTIPAEAAVGWWYGTPDYLEVVRLYVQDVMLD